MAAPRDRPFGRCPVQRGEEGRPALASAQERGPMGAPADPEFPGPERPIDAASRALRPPNRGPAPELESTLRTVAHDLRTPLVSILGFARLLEQDCGDALGERGRHYLRRIQEGGRQMEALLVDLLGFTRSGRPAPVGTHTDVRRVAREIAESLAPQLAERRVDLRIPPRPFAVRCERTALYQVLSNLIGNALRHMGRPPAPRIEVACHRRPGGAEIAVMDNGVGVPPEDRERIFELFERGRPVRDDEKPGTGIGLAIVRRIAEAHGGRARVDERPGGGARFRVYFPDEPD